ncbi:adenylate kinase [Candidatus Margulisiibacteriota bacterium]
MNIILLGPPGSGKGTQAVRLAEKLKLPHIAVGDMLREAVAAKTETGNKIESLMKNGMLVPDEITIELVQARLSRKDCDKGFILDGFPRSQEQANALDELLDGLDYTVLYIDIAMDAVIERNSQRLSCRGCREVYNLSNKRPMAAGICDKCGGKIYQREDDKPEVIKNRYQVYMTNTQPLVDHYTHINKIQYISGEGEIEAVSIRLNKALHIE